MMRVRVDVDFSQKERLLNYSHLLYVILFSITDCPYDYWISDTCDW